jgi:broad specificity phosphatase PhoE
MLVRHAARPPLPAGDAGYALPITETGARQAIDLGRLLGARLRTLHTSPLLRCVQTAEALCEGAARAIAIHPSRLLGDPGVYVLDDRVAADQWSARGHEGVMAHLVREDHALPGMAVPDHAARILVEHMLAIGAEDPGLHAFVTHDSLVTATAARLLREPFGPEAWPRYLEAAFFWQQEGTVWAAYREICRECRALPRSPEE